MHPILVSDLTSLWFQISSLPFLRPILRPIPRLIKFTRLQPTQSAYIHIPPSLHPFLLSLYPLYKVQIWKTHPRPLICDLLLPSGRPDRRRHTYMIPLHVLAVPPLSSRAGCTVLSTAGGGVPVLNIPYPGRAEAVRKRGERKKDESYTERVYLVGLELGKRGNVAGGGRPGRIPDRTPPAMSFRRWRRRMLAITMKMRK